VQRVCRGGRIRRGYEWPSLEAFCVGKGAVKPDAQLPRDLEGGECVRLFAGEIVRRPIAGRAQLVEGRPLRGALSARG
jgi:hypothetical protein